MPICDVCGTQQYKNPFGQCSHCGEPESTTMVRPDGSVRCHHCSNPVNPALLVPCPVCGEPAHRWILQEGTLAGCQGQCIGTPNPQPAHHYGPRSPVLEGRAQSGMSFGGEDVDQLGPHCSSSTPMEEESEIVDVTGGVPWSYEAMIQEETRFIKLDEYVDIENETAPQLFSYFGNKRKEMAFLNELFSHWKTGSSTLIEPFVGSAQVYLNTDFPSYIIADWSDLLFNLYASAQGDPERLLAIYETLENTVPSKRGFRHLVQLSCVNDCRFDGPRRAAAFLYLMSNSAPPPKPYRPMAASLKDEARDASAALKFLIQKMRAHPTQVLHLCWQDTVALAKKGDVIFADPPYVQFTRGDEGPGIDDTYSQEGFGWDQQEEIAAMAAEKSAQGITVIITNFATKATVELYQKYGATKLYTYAYPVQRSTQDIGIVAVFAARG
jgi:DNA adenine methylase